MAWERSGNVWARPLDEDHLLSVVASDGGWYWSAMTPERRENTGGGPCSLLVAMEAADEWAYEQGYRPERSEGER